MGAHPCVLRHDGGVDWFGTPMTPLAGGYSGETFLVGAGDDEVVMRIYARDPERCVVDASLLRLLEGVLPVPHVLDERPATDGKPGVLVTERLRGKGLDLVLPAASTEQRIQIGEHLGRLLATLSGIPMLRFGMFARADLHISSTRLPTDLVEWAGRFRDTGRLAGWSEPDWHGLLTLVERAETLLTGEPHPTRQPDPRIGRVVLCHSDFNPKNILIDPDSLGIIGLLDWEFAHAGSPYTDLGNLTRFERQPDFVDAVMTTYVDHAPPLVADPLLLGRAADLWALIELAGADRSNDVRRLAEELLLAQARDQDLMAWPWVTSRRSPAVSTIQR